MTRRLAILAAVVGAAWLALDGSTAVSPPLLTYSVRVPLPNGSYYAGLCVARPDGSRRMRLSSPGFVRDAAWSSDGRYVAYMRNTDVFLANANGTGERNLTRGFAEVSGEPAWSPDGRRLAFISRGSQGLSSVGLVERDGSGRRFLRSVPGNPSEPAWAPNGRELAVVLSSLVPPTHDLYVVAIDGSGSRLVASSAAEPSWAPDGARIAFIRAGNLVVANADGSGSRVVAAGAASPAWSPDGRLIAFVRGGILREGAVLAVRPDGGGERIVVRGPLPVSGPAWRATAGEPAGTRRPCVLTGTARADAIRGTAAAEIILGGSGADTIFAGGGADVVVAGLGSDFVHGQSGADQLVGGAGRDRLYGGSGDDVLYALDSERDLLDGGLGRDGAFADVGLSNGVVDRLRSIER